MTMSRMTTFVDYHTWVLPTLRLQDILPASTASSPMARFAGQISTRNLLTNTMWLCCETVGNAYGLLLECAMFIFSTT